MVVISTIFRHYHMPFHRDDVALLLHVLEGLQMIYCLFLKGITLDWNYLYILIKQRPCWIDIAKEEWLLCFRSNTIIWNMVKFWIFLTVYFKRKAYFKKLVPFSWRWYLSLALESIFKPWPRIFLDFYRHSFLKHFILLPSCMKETFYVIFFIWIVQDLTAKV